MMSLKERIKRIVPLRLKYYYYLFKAIEQVKYDLRRRVHDKVYNSSSAEQLKRDLTLQYHIIEKGLTMPLTRPGFSKIIIIKLCDLVLKYEKLQFPQTELEFVQSVAVLKEYFQFHKDIDYKLDTEVLQKLLKIVYRFNELKGMTQLTFTDEEYFKYTNAPFDVFSNSRYSVRNYSENKVPQDLLYQCIEIAQKSPSFCNRQPTRVHIVKSATIKQQILDIQNGNSGFGHLAETMLVISSIISTTKDIHERNENHLNGGMFAMSLLNALHFNKMAACALNWAVSEDKEIQLRKILNLPQNEIPILIILCGFPPENFKVAASPRKKANEITTEHL